MRHWDSFARMVAPWPKVVLDLILPPGCFVCNARRIPLHEDQPICPACYATCTPLEPPFCERCGEPYPGEIPRNFLCPNCRGRTNFSFDFAISGYHFSGPVREMVHGFKFEHQYELRGLLGWFARRALQDPRIASRQDWLVVPVPLHAVRHREREYNQSEKIAMEISNHTKFPLINGLRRTRSTAHQVNLSRAERLKNLKGAFDLTKMARKTNRFENKAILLIDDVLTTGSTVDECARVLKTEGKASLVAALTVARG